MGVRFNRGDSDCGDRPPSRKNILRAIEKLKDAGALTKNEALTPLGQQIARLPLEVSLAKLAIFGVIFKCLDPVLAIISLLTSKSPFVSGMQGSQDDARHVFKRGDSDLLSSLNAYESWKKAKAARTASEFCRKYHISDQTSKFTLKYLPGDIMSSSSDLAAETFEN